jgi:hypothetical protein
MRGLRRCRKEILPERLGRLAIREIAAPLMLPVVFQSNYPAFNQ